MTTPFYGSGVWTTRPWGKYCNLDDGKALVEKCFKNLDIFKMVENYPRITPKILVVKPYEKISWQYHFRRDEYWYIISGNPEIIISDNDNYDKSFSASVGQIFHIKKMQRHRIISKNEETVVGEIWHHVDPVDSNESDIIRIDDNLKI